MNVVLLRGVVERAPEVRQLADGTELAVLDVRTEVASGRATAPVAWVTDGQPLPEVGTEVVVTGHVRRRFFRAGGGTQSRTEVVADAVVPAAVPSAGSPGGRRRGRAGARAGVPMTRASPADASGPRPDGPAGDYAAVMGRAGSSGSLRSVAKERSWTSTPCSATTPTTC